MSFFMDSSESGVSSISSSPRSSTSTRGGAEYSLEEIDSSFVLSSSPESTARPITIREGETTKLGKCVKHSQPIRFYCSDCRAEVCVDCAVKTHAHCDVELLRSVTLKLCEAFLEKDVNEFRATRENLQNIRASFDCKVNVIKKEIDVVADSIIEEIERKRCELKKKLRIAETSRHDNWIHQIELCQRSINRLKSHLGRVKTLYIEDVNVLRKNILTEIGGGLDFIDDGEINVEFGEKPVFNLGTIKAPPCPKKSNVEVPKNSFAFRYNTCIVHIRNIMGEVSDGEHTVTAFIQDADFKSVYVTIKNEGNCTYKISYYPTKTGQYNLYVYLNLVAVGKSPYKLNVAYEESEHVPRCCFTIEGNGDGKLSKPWGICADFRGRILVADRGNNCVRVFTEDGAYVYSFGKMGSGPGEFLRPTGIAVDHILQRIVISDKDNHRIQVFNMRGIYLLEFGSEGEKNGQFNYPWDVSVSESSLIAVSDSKNRRIQLFDQRGGFIRKFSFNVKHLPNIELPRGLIFRADGSLIITDFNKHKLITLDESFENPEEFGSEGSDLTQFFRPQSVDVDHMGRIAVADCNNHRIQVFTPDGELYCAFGTQGREKGELDSPQGVCFLSNGHLAVVELTNNRVQVFKIPESPNN